MNHEQLQRLKLWVSRLWLLSPERLWLLSIGLRGRGHWMIAFWVKQLNTMLYHNSLAPGASVSPDVRLGHNSIGIVVTNNVVIGTRVKIWQNVTLSAGRPARAAATEAEHSAAAAGSLNGADKHTPDPPERGKIVLEDGVSIGANAVVIAPRGRSLRIGRGARIGAGTVVTKDVPAGARVVGAPVRVLPKDAPAEELPAQ